MLPREKNQSTPPATLVAATRLVAGDLRRASGLQPELLFTEAPDATGAWRVTAIFNDGLEAGFEVDVADTCSLLAPVADGLQQALIEYLGHAVPRCPAHEHPLKPVRAPGAGVWVCPISGDSYGEIGRLHLEPGYAAGRP